MSHQIKTPVAVSVSAVVLRSDGTSEKIEIKNVQVKG